MMNKATISRLKAHFKETYGLNDIQIEAMLQSSATSLKTVFDRMDGAFDENGDCDFNKLQQLSHNVKGLLMNMGEMSLAEKAEQLEALARKQTEHDYKADFDQLSDALSEVRRYGQ